MPYEYLVVMQLYAFLQPNLRIYMLGMSVRYASTCWHLYRHTRTSTSDLLYYAVVCTLKLPTFHGFPDKIFRIFFFFCRFLRLLW